MRINYTVKAVPAGDKTQSGPVIIKNRKTCGEGPLMKKNKKHVDEKYVQRDSCVPL